MYTNTQVSVTHGTDAVPVLFCFSLILPATEFGSYFRRIKVGSQDSKGWQTEKAKPCAQDSKAKEESVLLLLGSKVLGEKPVTK